MALTIQVNGNPVWSTEDDVYEVTMLSAKGRAGTVEVDDPTISIIELKVK